MCTSTRSWEKRPNSSFILLVLFSRLNRSAFSVIPDTHIIPIRSTTVTWLKMLSQLLSPIEKKSGGSLKMVSFFEKILLQNVTVKFMYLIGFHHIAFMKRWEKTVSILWVSNTEPFKPIYVSQYRISEILFFYRQILSTVSLRAGQRAHGRAVLYTVDIYFSQSVCFSGKCVVWHKVHLPTDV